MSYLGESLYATNPLYQEQLASTTGYLAPHTWTAELVGESVLAWRLQVQAFVRTSLGPIDLLCEVQGDGYETAGVAHHHARLPQPPSKRAGRFNAELGSILSRGAPPLEIPSRHPELVLSGASAHNLKSVELHVKLGRLNVVAGVSGSGKSTLVRQVLLPAVRQSLDLVTAAPGPFAALRGVEHLKRAIAVDQSPIGRTPRSEPATFLGAWDEIRTILAATPEAQVAGYTRSRS